MPAAQHATVTSPGPIQWVQEEKDTEGVLPPPPIGVLEGHGSATLNPRWLEGNLGRVVNTAIFTRFRGGLANLPEAGSLPDADDSRSGIKTHDVALARHRSVTGSGAPACLQVQPFKHARTISASEYVPMSYDDTWA